MNKVRQFRESYFCSDAADVRFHGYTNGDTWNGFACPYFEYDEAVRVLEALGNKWTYDGQLKVFLVFNEADPPDYEPEEFYAVEIEIDDKKIEVYGIGAYSWAWGVCE